MFAPTLVTNGGSCRHHLAFSRHCVKEPTFLLSFFHIAIFDSQNPRNSDTQMNWKCYRELQGFSPNSDSVGSKWHSPFSYLLYIVQNKLCREIEKEKEKKNVESYHIFKGKVWKCQPLFCSWSQGLWDETTGSVLVRRCCHTLRRHRTKQPGPSSIINNTLLVLSTRPMHILKKYPVNMLCIGLVRRLDTKNQHPRNWCELCFFSPLLWVRSVLEELIWRQQCHTMDAQLHFRIYIFHCVVSDSEGKPSHLSQEL